MYYLPIILAAAAADHGVKKKSDHSVGSLE